MIIIKSNKIKMKIEYKSLSRHSFSINKNGKLINDLSKYQKNNVIHIPRNEFMLLNKKYNNTFIKIQYLTIGIWEKVFPVRFDKEMIVKMKNKTELIPELPKQKQSFWRKLKKVIKEFSLYDIKISPSYDEVFPMGYIDHRSEHIPLEILEKSENEIKYFIFNPLSILYIKFDG